MQKYKEGSPEGDPDGLTGPEKLALETLVQIAKVTEAATDVPEIKRD